MDSEDGEDTMRDFPEWMNPVDERILEFLRDEHVGTPKRVGKNLEKHPNYAGERMRLMVRADLVERIDRGVYTISDQGVEWLDEERSADGITDPTETEG